MPSQNPYRFQELQSPEPQSPEPHAAGLPADAAERLIPSPQPRFSSAARDLFYLATASALLFFIALGARDLWNPNEPIYGRAVVEMAERGDWRIPTVNGKVFAEKPILYFWSARVVSLLMGGVSEFSLRVPSAVAGVTSVLLTYLLVLPYSGRRRALIAAALFATLHQVFWAARSVQMDILVLTTTLGVVLPLTRMLDFGMRPRRAWALAGIAAGFGFIAKGPVTWILPAMIVILYSLSQRKLHVLWSRWIALALTLALVIGAPWYIALWLGGDTAFLHEVLIRQNFSRFVKAWDHSNPWWYYFTYLVTDYAPWSVLLPAALVTRGVSGADRRLTWMSWIWIASIVFFFSLADSKRAPYILPIAPAVAVLAASVIDRWTSRGKLARAERIASTVAISGLILAVLAASAYGTFRYSEVPVELQAAAVPFLWFLLIAASLLLFALVRSDVTRKWVPAGLLSMVLVTYFAAAVWLLPAVDPLKSARGFSASMNEQLRLKNGTIASYRLWRWRAGYSYYAGRTIPNLEEPAALLAFWRSHEQALVFVEEAHRNELQALIPDASLVREQQIGGRKASLFVRNPRYSPISSGAIRVSRNTIGKEAEATRLD